MLDLMLPAPERAGRASKPVRLESDLPVIILSARASEAERINGLQLGADDYIVKPYSPREVVGGCERCCAARAPTRTAATCGAGDPVVAGERREVMLRRPGGAHHPQGVRLLHCWRAIPASVFSRSQLLERTSGATDVGRRHRHGHRPRPSPPAKVEARAVCAATPCHGARRRLPVRSVSESLRHAGVAGPGHDRDRASRRWRPARLVRPRRWPPRWSRSLWWLAW